MKLRIIWFGDFDSEVTAVDGVSEICVEICDGRGKGEENGVVRFAVRLFVIEEDLYDYVMGVVGEGSGSGGLDCGGGGGGVAVHGGMLMMDLWIDGCGVELCGFCRKRLIDCCSIEDQLSCGRDLLDIQIS